MIYYYIGDCMKNKMVIVLVILGVLLVASGGALSIVNGFKGEQENLAKTMNIIVDDYEVFRKKVEKFSTFREGVYSEVMSTQYYADVFNKYTANVAKLREYEVVVADVDAAGKNLKSNCIGKNFNDKSVVNKCNAFVINYEQTINYFVSDIARFNSRIKEYNEWIKTDTTGKYKAVNEYDSKYKDYVDINNDKIFSGKAEK